MTPQALLSGRPALAAALAEAPDAYRVERSQSGAPVAVRVADGKWFGSRYDPVKELRRWREKQQLRDDDFPVILGFNPALFQLFPERPLLIVEKDASLLKALLQAISIEGTAGAFVVLDESGIRLQSAVRLHFDIFRHLRVKVMALPQVEDEAWKTAMATAARDVQREISMNLLAYAYQLPRWLEAAMRNLATMMEAPDPALIRDSMQGETAVIVAAGPSLDRNIAEIERFRGRALIIAVDTALRALDSRGIVPDIAVAVDANRANERDFDGLSAAMLSEPLLVADAIVAPGMVNRYSGPKTFFRSINYMLDEEGRPVQYAQPLDRLLIELAGRAGLPEWQSGGSVSTNAFSLARYLGIRRMILVGHDFAFTEGRTHVKGVGYEDACTEGMTRFATREGYFRDRIAEGNISVPAWRPDSSATNAGGMVVTSPVMREFIRWYELSIRYGFAQDCEVIDATEGGARIEGTRAMTLREAAEQWGNRPFSFQPYREKLRGGARIGREGWRARLSEFVHRADALVERPEAIAAEMELARWLILPVYLGGRSMEPEKYECYVRNSLVNALEFIRKVSSDAGN